VAAQFHWNPDTYLEMIRAEVPSFDALQAAAVASVPFPPGSALDLGIGTGETSRRLLEAHPDARITGLDSSPEMVVAFIPSESLLSAALEADPSIMEFAFSKHVALASPVTLFSVLKAVAVSWRHEVVTQEAKALFDVSRELYSRLTTLATHVDKLGRSIERSAKDYNTFVGSLEHQVLPSARRLSQLDESKVLPDLTEIDEDTRQLTSSDLTAELTSLDELDGVARPELDLGLVTPPVAKITKPKSA